MTTRIPKSMAALGMGCLAAALCVPAGATDAVNTGTKHKQVHRPETESHKAEAKANTATAKASHPEAKSNSQAEHHSAHSATSHKKPHTAGTSSHHGKKTKPVSHRGQQKIEGDRTRQIQEALIREHYLTGEATGKWDPSTEAALRKLQADNGWQNKTVPDSRALIKLGLGPSNDHLLNPESAMTSAPEAVQGAPSGISRSTAPITQPQQ